MWIPHSFALTIQPLTPCNDIIQYAANPAGPYHLGSFKKPPSSPHFRCNAMFPSKRCSGSLAVNSPACLSQYCSKGIYS